jgi:FMN-dependent NADH-azoreductase
MKTNYIVDHWEGNCSLSTLTSRPLFSYVQAGKKERKKERKTFLVDFRGGIYSENKHISPKLL